MNGARQIVLWSTAAALVMAAHVAALAWLAQRAIGAVIARLPPAIEIELIAAPMADPVADGARSVPAMPDPAHLSDPAPPPVTPPAPAAMPAPEPAPVPDLPPLIPLPPTVIQPAATPVPESPRTKSDAPRRPKDPPPRKVEKPRASPKAAAPAPPAEDRSAKGESVKKAPPGAALQGASPGAMARWQDKVTEKIAAHMARTRASGRGKAVPVTLAVTIAANGQVSARLAGSTGDAGLDAAISRQAARIPRMPPPPDGQVFRLTRTIRVQFR